MASFTSWPQSPFAQPIRLSPKDRQKKPRHRHSPAQLAALNELYEKSDHPALDERTTLAEHLGMETKTVNAWFQNKRASTKKRTRGGVTYDLPPISSILGSTSSSSTNTPHQTELDDFVEDDYSPVERYSRSIVSLEEPQHQSSFYAGNPEHRHFFAESDIMPRRMRVRPTAIQTDELRKLYNTNPHPTKEVREELGERIGMRYQSITNWFQNQRSLAKKRKEDEMDTAADKSYMVEFPYESRTFSAFPPPSSYPSPSLPLSPSNHAPLSLGPQAYHLPSVSSLSAPRSMSPRALHRDAADPRSGRSCPETYQLSALQDLFARTPNPSIEERSALASEIGMDVGQVTNWFRNLRQSARKRTKKINGEDYDDDGSITSWSVSRSGTPSLRSSSSSSGNDGDDLMDLGDEYDGHHKHVHSAHSDNGSEEEHEEAVTPSPEPSPSPLSPPFTAALHHNFHGGLGFHAIDPVGYAELDKATAARYSGIKVEDALLLLSFHHHVVH